ncbi:MAG: pyruvate dehydrogenase complex E1 component subunit beta [Deltaproteobacteria bacterium]|nr:pyruvate dehydrogenase complex E1 component subunit beta [Deltaproteobacteria bacterium]
MRTLSIREALNEALAEELQRDESVFLMGEEVGYYDGAYKVSRDLLKRFGERRIVDTPISENGFAGVGVGAALIGLRPIIEFMTFNFSLIGIDQVINAAAKMRYMSAGQYKLPIVFRGPGGSVHQLAAQHSQSLESFFVHVPGLIVIMPSTPADAKGLLKSAVRNDNPVVFIESEAMYSVKGEVPDDPDYLIDIGTARIRQSGSDVTLFCWSKTVPTCLSAAEQLSSHGISAEVIDLRTLRPLDEEVITTSVMKTNRAVVVQEAWPQASVGSFIAQRINETLFDYLDAPVLVLSGLDIPYPYAKNLEQLMAPNVDSVVKAVERLM